MPFRQGNDVVAPLSELRLELMAYLFSLTRWRGNVSLRFADPREAFAGRPRVSHGVGTSIVT